MDEGHQIEAENGAQPSDKVVRLPRDWLGPREHLVPFGATPLVESDPVGLAPSADDFWGERAATIQDVVQAPEAEPRPRADQPATGGPRPSTSRSRLARLGLAAACLAGVAAAVVAIVLLSTGSPQHASGGARLDLAAILNSGVSKIAPRISPPRIVARATAPRTVKHVPHRSPRRKPTAAPSHHHTTPPPASAYVSHAAPPAVQPTYHPTVSTPTPRVYTTPTPAPTPTPTPTRPRAASTASSGARVSPTGQSGALGPVQSPNG